MRVRHFDEEIERFATQFCDVPVISEPFTIIDATRQGGGTGAVRVRMDHSGRVAWAKPEGVGRDRLRDVAHEQIGAALAFRLGLPVAPVAISHATDGKNLHPIVALSYETLGSGRPLSQAATPEIMAHIRPALSAMFPFLAWIDDHDHFGGHNAQFEIQGGVGRVSFYDWGHSLTRAWQIPGPAPARDQWRAPTHPFGQLDRAVTEAVLQRIEGFSLNELERIITGVSPDCLPPNVQRDLIQALHVRGGELRGVLNF